MQDSLAISQFPKQKLPLGGAVVHLLPKIIFESQYFFEAFKVDILMSLESANLWKNGKENIRLSQARFTDNAACKPARIPPTFSKRFR